MAEPDGTAFRRATIESAFTYRVAALFLILTFKTSGTAELTNAKSGRVAFQNVLATAAFVQFFFCVLLAVAIPKATTISLAILLCGSLIIVLVEGAGRSVIRSSSREKWLWAVSLPFFVAGSTIWTGHNPTLAFQAATTLAFTLIACVIIGDATTVLPPSIQRSCYFGFLIGFAAAASVAALDLIYSQALTRWVFTAWPSLPEANTSHVVFEEGRAIRVSEATTNRRAIVLTCLLPAVSFCLLKSRSSRAAQLIGLVGVTAYATHTWFTYSLTAQLAFVAFVVTAASAWIVPQVTRAIMAMGWISAWALIVPIVIGLTAVELHEAKWLPFSSTERVRIWSGVADDVLERPLLGNGIGSKAEYSPGTPPGAIEREPSRSGLAHHPHNTYLQVWYELGAIGVIFFAVFGLWILRLIDNAKEDIKPYLLGLFSTVAAINLTGFGLWQHWHLSAFGLGAGLLWVVSQAHFIDRAQGD